MNGVAFTVDEVKELKAKIVAYMEGGYGRVLYAACAAAGVNFTTVWQWRNKDKDFAEAIEAARKAVDEGAIQVAEDRSFTLLEKGDAKHIRWFLETKGKGKGYVKRQEIVNRDQESVNQEAEDARNSLLSPEVPPAVEGTADGAAGEDNGQTSDNPTA